MPFKSRLLLLTLILHSALAGCQVKAPYNTIIISPVFELPASEEEIQKLHEPVNGSTLSEAQAIKLANLYCVQTHSYPRIEPTTYQANQTSLQVSGIRGSGYPPSQSVWIIVMDGEWPHYPPPPPAGTPHVKEVFSQCRVVLNANNGDLIGLTN